MYSIFVIALNTFKEAIRNRILYVILIFAIVLIISAGVVSDLSVSSPNDIIRSMGLWGINFFSIMIAVFVGIGLVYNEIDKKTIYTIVSKPIDRTHFILGKYFGLLITIYANVIIMSLIFLMAVYFYDGLRPDNIFLYLENLAKTEGRNVTHMDQSIFYVKNFFSAVGKGCATFVGAYQADVTQNLMKVLLLNAFELAILVAFAVMFSSFSTPILSAILTIMTFLVGRGNEDIIRYVWKMERQISGALEPGSVDFAMQLKYWMAWLTAHIAPNLTIFYRASDAIYSPTVDIHWAEILYGFTYPAAILALAILIFRRRNFK